MAGANGKHGGARLGAGRKSKASAPPTQLPLPALGSGTPPSAPLETDKPRSIEWNLVTRYARTGIGDKDIRVALDITDDLLDPVSAARFAKIISRGHAQHRVDLQIRLNERGRKTKEG